MIGEEGKLGGIGLYEIPHFGGLGGLGRLGGGLGD